MITYEVTATVPDDISNEYDTYMLDKHIAEVVAAGRFASATYYLTGSSRRTIYEARDQASLDRYLAGEADRLRKDFLKHFSETVSVTRENWEVVALFEE